MVRKDHKDSYIPSGYKGKVWKGIRKCPCYKKCGKMYDYRNGVPHFNDLGFCSLECREKYIISHTSFSFKELIKNGRIKKIQY